LHAAAHNLSWRTNAVKIAILIADAPPHGLDSGAGDTWPNGRKIFSLGFLELISMFLYR